jgi:hypothetical protein
VRNANLATLERLTMSPVPIVKIAMLVNTVNAKKTTGSTLLIQLCALTAPLAGPPRRAAPNAKLAKQVLLVIPWVPIVKIAMLVNTVNAKKTAGSTLLIQLRALTAPLAGPPRRAAPNAKLAKQVLLAISPVPIVKIAMLGNTVKAKKTTVSTLLIRWLVLIAQQGIHQVRVVPSANPVELGRTVLGVKAVVQVNTVTVRIQ